MAILSSQKFIHITGTDRAYIHFILHGTALK